jgi:basic amino acid/polyamine antiporter, APA family
VAQPESLRRLVGPVTTFLISLGVAIGSGIFRAPTDVAQSFRAPWMMLLIWVIGGIFSLVSGLVSAELATRFPKAGGEYAFVREAFGDFFAFFFGWGYSVFIIGCGAATIAAASGEAAAQLFDLDVAAYAPGIGALIVVLITGVNALGLKAGAGLGNVLTAAKILALVGIAFVALVHRGSDTRWLVPLEIMPDKTFGAAFISAVVPVMFAYAGTTDTVKLAEEIQNVRRDLPRALIGSAFALTLLYLAVNVAYLVVLTPDEMAKSLLVPSDAMSRIFGSPGRRVMSFLNLVVFLGAISATILATVRVTFALARDGLTFKVIARMSRAQAPVPALLVVGGIATLLTYSRSFEQILNIYYLGSSVLYGLAYASLIMFRWRDRTMGTAFPTNAFRCPAGPLLASLLILFQLYLAQGIVVHFPDDSLYTVALLAFFALLYLIWRRFAGRGTAANS